MIYFTKNSVFLYFFFLRRLISKEFFFLQYSTYQQLKEQKKSEKFFKVLYDRMKAAQQEIRSTVTVNTIDLGSKKKDEDGDLTISVPKKRGKEVPCKRGE